MEKYIWHPEFRLYFLMGCMLSAILIGLVKNAIFNLFAFDLQEGFAFEGLPNFPNYNLDSLVTSDVYPLQREERQPVLIFPNPATDEIWVSNLEESMTCQIIDVTGNIVEILKPGMNHAFQISHIPSGVYFLKTLSGNPPLDYSKFIKY
jgi:hypothetical protein